MTESPFKNKKKYINGKSVLNEVLTTKTLSEPSTKFYNTPSGKSREKKVRKSPTTLSSHNSDKNLNEYPKQSDYILDIERYAGSNNQMPAVNVNNKAMKSNSKLKSDGSR